MDLFEAIVRLEAKGLTAGPPAEVPAGAPPDLARLLKKLSSLRGDGVDLQFDASPTAPVGFQTRLPAAPLSGDTWMVWGPERTSVLRLQDGRTVFLARSLPDLLVSLLVDDVPVRTEPEPLADLGVDGDGWGWPVASMELPAVLVRSGLPDDLRPAPMEVDAEHAWIGHRVLAPVEAAPTEEAEAPPSAEEDGLDELFGSGSGRARPRSGLIAVLLISGLLLALLGMLCISVPGGALVLLAWMHVEKDNERLENGYLPPADGPIVARNRQLTYAGLLLVVLLFFAQAILLCGGFYDVLLDRVYIPVWRSFIIGMLGGGAPVDTDLPL